MTFPVPDRSAVPADVAGGDPFTLAFKQPVRRVVPWAVGAVVLLVLTAVELSAGTGLNAGPPLVVGAVVTSGMAVIRAVLATRPAPVAALPTEINDGITQLDVLLEQAPHTRELLHRTLSVPFSLPHRFVRSTARRRREELARAVATWAPEVTVVLGPPVDFRTPRLLGPVLRDGVSGVRSRFRGHE